MTVYTELVARAGLTAATVNYCQNDVKHMIADIIARYLGCSHEQVEVAFSGDRISSEYVYFDCLVTISLSQGMKDMAKFSLRPFAIYAVNKGGQIDVELYYSSIEKGDYRLTNDILNTNFFSKLIDHSANDSFLRIR